MTVTTFTVRRTLAIGLNTALLAAGLVAAQIGAPEPVAAAEPVTHAAGEAQALKLARKQNSDVTVDSLTTQSKTVKATPKGEFSATLTSGPTRIQQPDDSWAELDSELTRAGKVWVPKVAGNGVAIGATKLIKKVKVKKKTRKKVVGTVLATTTFPAASVAQFAAARNDPKVAASTPVGWPKGIAPNKTDPKIRVVWPGKVASPQVDGNIATYRNIRAGIDLQLTATSSGVVPSFTLTRPVTKKTVLALPLDVSGLRVSGAKKGGYRITDSAGRVIAAGTSMGFATGATPGKPGRSVASVPIKVKKSQLQVTLTPKRFAKPGVPYPVTSTAVAAGPQVTTNGFVWSATPNTSYMTQGTINVGRFVNDNSVGRMFVGFDDSAIKGSIVTSATLSMYQSNGSACSQPRLLVGTPNSPWNTGLTWANQPAMTGKYYGFSDTQGHVIGQPKPCAPDYINPTILAGAVSITPLVTGWAGGTIVNNGVEVVSEDEASPASARVIESTRTTSMFGALKINVTYTPVPAAPTNPVVSPIIDGFVPTDQPTLSAVLPTSCGVESQTCAGRFQIVDAAGTVVWKGASDVTGTAGQKVETKVPSSANLANGVPYTLQVFTVANRSTASPTSANAPFVVDQVGPDNPTIASGSFFGGYQNGQWTNPAPANPSFVFNSNGAAAFQVLLDGVSRPNVIVTSGTSATMTWKPADGWHTMTVWAVDKAGIQSREPATFTFGSGGAGISAPTDQSRSALAFQVAASAPVKSGDLPRQVQATWQKQGDGDNWTPLSEGLISNGGEWDRNPQQRDPGLFTPADLIWDTAKTPGVGNGPTMLNLKLCFTFLIDADNPECDTQKVQISRHAFGGNFATAPVGPGSVSLSTGELQVPASDAALPGSDVTRGVCGSRRPVAAPACLARDGRHRPPRRVPVWQPPGLRTTPPKA